MEEKDIRGHGHENKDRGSNHEGDRGSSPNRETRAGIGQAKSDAKNASVRESGPSEPTDSSKTRKAADSTSRLGGRKEKWKTLHTHLDQALNQWNDISEQMKDELSPDQKQLQEVKSLLQQLKTKLDQF